MIGIAAAWLIWSILNGVIAGQKGRSGVGVFLLSLVLSPVLGSLYILAVPTIAKPAAGTPEAKAADQDRKDKALGYAIIGGIVLVVVLVSRIQGCR